MFKDIFDELRFKFSHLGSLQPENIKSRINLLDFMISDNFVQGVSPLRYAFYINFWNQAKKDPKLLESITYETELIKADKNKEADIINKILAKLNNLYNLEITEDVINNDDLYIEKKNRLMKFESNRLKNRLKRIFANDDGSDSRVEKIIDDTFTPDTIRIDEYKPTSGGSSVIGGAPPDNQLPVIEEERQDVEDVEGAQIQDGEDMPVNGQEIFDTESQSLPPTIQAVPFDTNQPGPDGMMPVVTSQAIYLFIKEFYDKTSKDITDNIKPVINNKELSKDDLEKLKQKLNDYVNTINEILQTIPEEVKTKSEADYIQLRMEAEKLVAEVEEKLQKLKEEKAASEIKAEALKSAYEEIKKETEENDKKVKIKQKVKEDAAKLGKTNLNKIRKSFLDRSILNTYQRRLRKILDNKTTTDAKLKAAKLMDVIDDIENNDATTINSLALTKEDKLVFIGICFIIRLISLGIIDWALNTNYIVSFTHSYILYVILYCIFMLLMIAVINITYRYPVYSLYNGNHGIFTALASVMYFFYLTPDYVLSSSVRIIVHFGIIIFLTTIAILIKSNQENNEQLLNYNYTEKKRIRRALSNFTLLLWFFTSVVAMYMF